MTWTLCKPGPTHIGRYELLGRVGQGANGSVHRGRDLDTDRVVAVKLLNPELARDPQSFRRFEQEFLATRLLADPHIVRTLAFGQEGGVPYLVMEFVEGESLRDRLNRAGLLGRDEAFGITSQIARGLHCAHEWGLVHRDVKPGNILLAGGVAKLSDFGLVKDLTAASSLTETATALGTPSYMAPEQIEDSKRVDRRCDVYGLAATLYLAITGRVPFAGAEARARARGKPRGELVPPRQLANWLSVRSERAILRALDANPLLRPGSCAEFSEDLTGGENWGAARALAVPGLSARSLPAAQPAEARAKGGTPPVPVGAPPRYAGPERRAGVRYDCRLEGVCRPVGAREGTGWPVEVRDLSESGVGLHLGRRFERGTLLIVEVRTRGAGGPRTLLARVIYAEAHARQGWSVGCLLAQRLGPEELRDLLEGTGRSAGSGRLR